MTEVKSIPLDKKEFTANGKKYFIQEKISALRYREYEKLVPELTFGIGFKEIFAQLLKVWGFLNKAMPEPGSAAVIVHNLMNGIKSFEDPKRHHPALMIAALVILREGEDPTTIDEKLMTDKIADWHAEGLDMMSFFALSLNAIEGFRETLSAYTSQIMEKISQDLERA